MLKTVTTQAARAPLAWKHCYQNIVQLISHVQLCDLIDCSTSVFPVLHCLPELAQIHLTISSSVNSSSSYPQSLAASESFPMRRLFLSGGHSIGVSASASVSVFPMNIQGWLPLGLTGLISLQSKVLSRVFSSTTVQKHPFYNAQPSLWSDSYIHTWNLYIFFMLMTKNCKLNVILIFLWFFSQ